MLPTTKPYFIAETAFHHEGDADFLKELVEEICTLEINAIKFHLLFDLNDYIIKNHPAVEVLRKITFDNEYWFEILKKVKYYRKDIILLTNDIESLKWANSVQHQFDIQGVELHSTGLNDLFLLKECVNFDKTIILGVGGSSFDEIQYAVDFLRFHGKNDILLMHGFQNYPTKYEDINFRRMNLLREAFNLPIGYADHTDPKDSLNAFISVLPQFSSFNILEKHITNCFGDKRIDAQAAVSFGTMNEIITLANSAAKAVGSDNFRFSDAEIKYGNTGPMKKAMVARKAIKMGEIISLENIAYKRTESSSPLMQKDISKILNSRAKRNIDQDEILSFDNITYEFNSENFDQFFISKK